MSTTLQRTPTDPGQPVPSDWRLEIPEPRRARLRLWFLSGAALTFLIVIIGGITRLTQSGLSIVDWQPIMGVIPPLSEAEWQAAFNRYREFPEYQQLRRGMSLSEFKFIFFWEYLHRLAARTIGLVFLIPFAFFWLRGYFNPPLLRRSLLLFGLGLLQGFVGWFMVMSGLVDIPQVSHYRLATHLGIALTIFALCIWLARELKVGPAAPRAPTAGAGGVRLLGGLLLAQILWGAFVAGMDAGYIFNTFPKMAGAWLPPQGLELSPLARNLVENPATVQWVHRVLGTVLLVAAIAVFLRQRRRSDDPTAVRLAGGFAALTAAQYLLGVLTLVLMVPVPLGVAHQAMAVLILGVWIAWFHRTRTARTARPAALVRAA